MSERTDTERLMTPREFKYGLLRLANPDDSQFISERVVARRLAALYIDANEKTQLECSNMLTEDLAAMDAEEDEG